MEQKTYNIFVSYSHKDAEIASFLVSKLSDAGFTCFMSAKEILPSQQWSPKIHEALLNSDQLLILLTPRSKDSLWVAAEAGAAWGLGKEIIPALMFVDPKELIEIIHQWQSYSVETPTQIDLLINRLKAAVTISPTFQSINGHELFNDIDSWAQLLKIGNWNIDQSTGQFIGKGSFQYLLSSKDYGAKGFEIESCISFDINENTGSRMNAGFVLGWDNSSNNPKYYHLMFTGQEIILEQIGKNGGSEADFQHLTNGVPFPLKFKKQYEIKISYDNQSLQVLVDKGVVVNIPMTHKIVGRVGLRPWRSKMICDKFKVSETK